MWRSGRLIYDGASLAEVVADVQRHAPFPITLQGDFLALTATAWMAVFAPGVALLMLSKYAGLVGLASAGQHPIVKVALAP
ncbi:MAG: hypothetical protein AAGA68_16965 [Pseudomonadota bacterium]